MDKKCTHIQIKRDERVFGSNVEKVKIEFDHDDSDVIEDTDFFSDKHNEDEFD